MAFEGRPIYFFEWENNDLRNPISISENSKGGAKQAKEGHMWTLKGVRSTQESSQGSPIPLEDPLWKTSLNQRNPKNVPKITSKIIVYCCGWIDAILPIRNNWSRQENRKKKNENQPIVAVMSESCSNRCQRGFSKMSDQIYATVFFKETAIIN